MSYFISRLVFHSCHHLNYCIALFLIVIVTLHFSIVSILVWFFLSYFLKIYVIITRHAQYIIIRIYLIVYISIMYALNVYMLYMYYMYSIILYTLTKLT